LLWGGYPLLHCFGPKIPSKSAWRGTKGGIKKEKNAREISLLSTVNKGNYRLPRRDLAVIDFSREKTRSKNGAGGGGTRSELTLLTVTNKDTKTHESANLRRKKKRLGGGRKKREIVRGFVSVSSVSAGREITKTFDSWPATFNDGDPLTWRRERHKKKRRTLASGDRGRAAILKARSESSFFCKEDYFHRIQGIEGMDPSGKGK